MRLRPSVLALLLAVAPGLANAQDRSQEKFYLKDGDTVVFYGDSITDQRLYTTYVETYVVTRFPRLDVTFVHSGWGGDRVTGGGGGGVDLRLKRDVLAYKPTVMTVMLGMNDGSYRPFDKSIFDTYSKGMKSIVETVKKEAPGIRITLIKPSPYDDVTREPKFEGGYNAVLARYGDYLQELAGQANVDVADLNTSVVAATKKADEIDHEKAVQLNTDRVHPGPGGQLLMADALLKAWNAPALVSKVEIKTDSEKAAAETVNARVGELMRKDCCLTWIQRDLSLPFPINLADPVVALAVKASDVVKDLDQQILKVDGLDEPKYTLKIDGKAVGTFAKDQLAEGINLAVLDTPMTRQAAKVHDLTKRHTDIHQVRWRALQVPLQKETSPHVAKAIEELDAFEADLVKQQRDAAEPESHTFELSPAA